MKTDSALHGASFDQTPDHFGSASVSVSLLLQ